MLGRRVGMQPHFNEAGREPARINQLDRSLRSRDPTARPVQGACCPRVATVCALRQHPRISQQKLFSGEARRVNFPPRQTRHARPRPSPSVRRLRAWTSLEQSRAD